MNQNLYFTIGACFSLAGLLGPICYLIKSAKNYVFDKGWPNVNRFDLGFFILGSPSKDWNNKSSYDKTEFGGTIVSCLILPFAWPIFSVVGAIYLGLRTARFAVRITRGFSKIAKVAHKHEEGEIKKEEVSELKY